MKLRIPKKDRTHSRHQEVLNKATPLLVHLLMIGSVGLYAVLGAVIMRRLESRSLAEIRTEVESKWANVPDETSKHRRRHTLEIENILDTYEDGEESSRQKRAAAEVMRSRKCVIAVIKQMRGKCDFASVDVSMIKELDKCYHVAVEHATHTKDVIFKNSAEEVESVAEELEEVLPWSFMDSLLFAFTVITTIGYGNVAPRTFWGRLFVILYGLIGIPFTLLAIADMGKFLSEIMYAVIKRCSKFKRRLKEMLSRKDRKQYDFNKLNGGLGKSGGDGTPLSEKTTSIEEVVKAEEGQTIISPEDDKVSVSSDEEADDSQALPLFILFILYIGLGALLLCQYEPDMDFFKAVYFNFVTLTSIGLGDIVPRSETFMAVTIVYIAIGLALTTIAIEIAADTLKKLHYFGRKIENVANVPIWFGGKKLTMKQLVRNLGDQFNLPTTAIKNLDLDTFVDNAIKVEAGELETLRPPPFEPEQEVDDFADNIEDLVSIDEKSMGESIGKRKGEEKRVIGWNVHQSSHLPPPPPQRSLRPISFSSSIKRSAPFTIELMK